jgi:hypothetical protein
VLTNAYSNYHVRISAQTTPYYGKEKGNTGGERQEIGDPITKDSFQRMSSWR